MIEHNDPTTIVSTVIRKQMEFPMYDYDDDDYDDDVFSSMALA